MPKSAAFENDILKLIFHGTAIANIADNAAASPLTNLYISLHTADPGAAGNQTTNECTYTGYARVDLLRSSGGFAVNSNVVTPVSSITFPQASAGSETATYLAVGMQDTGGAGKILFYGTLSPTIAITTGVIPELTTDTTITET